MKIIRFLKETVHGIWLFFRYGPHKVSQRYRQSLLDELTGLPNERCLKEVCRKELATSQRLKIKGFGYPVSLIYVDIDDFKKVNDEEGHAAGDEVLRRTARLLSKACRENDTVFRLHGDEFAIMLPLANRSDAQLVFERIKELAEKKLFSPQGKPIGLSGGLAQDVSCTLDRLKERADSDMYREKKSKVKS